MVVISNVEGERERERGGGEGGPYKNRYERCLVLRHQIILVFDVGKLQWALGIRRIDTDAGKR